MLKLIKEIKMDFGIQGKVALVLASSKGLGRAIAVSLAKEGAKVVLSGRTVSALDETANEIRQFGGQVMVLPWDMSDLNLIEEKISTIEKEWGTVDILVNNTGGPPPTAAENQSSDLWLTQFQQMVLMVIKITDRVLPGMKNKSWGRIITSTSSGMISPIPGLAISNTLRASIMGWSKTLASEVAKHGITVNIVLPGRVATERLGQLDQFRAQKEGKTVEEIATRMIASIPMARYGTPTEYGDAVTFLASTKASYITGTSLRIDGGSFSGF
jgi:3-oxoacyl-[acyl-carrier protein] reductase